MKHAILLLILICANLFSQSTWLKKTAQPLYDFNTIKFFNANTGIVAGAGGVIVRTTDSGNIWLNINSGTTKTINSFLFVDNSQLYAAGDSGLILFTSNQGVSWVSRNSGTLNKINSIAKISPSSFIACCAGGLLLHSTDAGVTWTSQVISGFNLTSAFCSDINNWYICGDSVVVLKTTNAGAGWSRHKVVNDAFSYPVRDIHFFDSNTGCARISSDVYRTTNAGVNWSSPGWSLRNTARMKFINNTTGYAIGPGSPISKTTNAGINWLPIGPHNHFNGNWMDIEVIDSALSFFCGWGGHILKSTNGDTTASHVGGLNFSSNNFAFYTANDGIVTHDNHILKTSNGGDKWKIQSGGYNDWFEANTIAYEKVKFSSYTNGCVFSRSYGMWQGGSYVQRTSNGGASFYGYLGGVPYAQLYDMETIDSSAIVVGTLLSANTQIYRANGGANWVTQHTMSNNYIVAGVSFANSSTGIVTGYVNATSKSFILRTTNSGINWEESTLPQPNKVRKADMLSGGTGYLLCDSGMILKTTNFGASWFINLNSHNPVFITINFLDESHGYAITLNNKLAFSSNGGTIWSIHDVAANTNLYSVQFIDPVIGYIGCSQGILKTTDGGITFNNMSSGLLPETFSLSQNYPNPFNPITNIKFNLPRSGFVKMTVYDVLGREITTLVNQQMQAGSYSADWDASAYPSGVYFYKIETEDFAETKKMILVK